MPKRQPILFKGVTKMSETIRETVDRAMRTMGFYDNPVTIGDSTHYVDADSPFAKNSRPNNVQKYNQEVMNNINQQQVQISDPNCYMTFNGQNLGLYNNTGLVNNLDAQSGQDNYQSGIYQNVVNKGPIPEGTYYANQDQRQNITAFDAAAGTGIGIVNKLGANIHRGTWNGGPISWGISRVWLAPDANTNTYGRDGFSIHGGWSKGSAGCIDIPWQTGKLNNYLDDCQDSVPLFVNYPKNW